MTKDCGSRKEPSYLGCEGCYCANAIDPVSPKMGFDRHAEVDYVPGCSDILCGPAGAAKGAAGGSHLRVTIITIRTVGWLRFTY